MKITTDPNECYATSASMEGNVAYGTIKSEETGISSSQQRDTMSQDHVRRASAILVEPNQCYDTATTSVDAEIELAQNEAYVTSAETPVGDSQFYDTIRNADQLCHVELTSNLAYTMTPDIPMETNQCYTSHTKHTRQESEEEDDYVIP